MFIHRAMAKYGVENFSFRVLEWWPTEAEALDAEAFLVGFTMSNRREFGFNLTGGGEGTCGMVHTEDAKRKIGMAAIGNKHRVGAKISDEWKRRLSELHRGNTYSLGYRHTEEAKAKISAASLSQGEETLKKRSASLRAHYAAHPRPAASPETLAKMSAAQRGKSLSDETRRKIGDSNRGKVKSAEARKKISDANSGERHGMFGRTHTEDARRRISEANSGRKHTDEARKKISEANRGKKRSSEQVQKMRERVASDETREKIRASLVGKRLSPETIAKRTETARQNMLARVAAGLPPRNTKARTKTQRADDVGRS